MFRDLRKRVKSVKLPPGTVHDSAIESSNQIKIIVTHYTEQDFQTWEGKDLASCPLLQVEGSTTWVNIQGYNAQVINEVGRCYSLHPLTMEDIANMDQRPKVEEFDNYEFITFKTLNSNQTASQFTVGQVCIVLGSRFVITFSQQVNPHFDAIDVRLKSNPTQRLRQHSGDYLVYRILDTIIDQYFVVLESIGNQIDKLEEEIISKPQAKSTRAIYRLKKKMLVLRKTIWPAREIVSHLLQSEETFITPFTRLYLRDLYDHIVLAIDSVETFRDMLSNMLDVYLSSLTNRMNEVMKTLTIISTIFIPMTFIASIYGMNFTHMPELTMRWGYVCTLLGMACIATIMLIYFRIKQWF